jgi:hypothetical protein
LRSNAGIRNGQSTILGTIVPAQRNAQMFQYVDQPYAEKLYNEMDRLAFTASFCSVFDDCWTTTSKDTPGEPVDRCTADATFFRE